MLTQQELQSALHYDSITGNFTWIKRVARSIHVNQLAGTKTDKNYIKISLNSKDYFAHRLAWLYVHGQFPEKLIDHVNGNPLDNSIKNLREADYKQNGVNRKVGKNKHGIKGIYFHNKSKRWHARAISNKKCISLGYFKYKESAAEAYLKYAKENHGEFFHERPQISRRFK